MIECTKGVGMKATRKSQCDRILEYLKTHESITDNEARDIFHCNRLSGRIHDLRKRGYAISTVMATGKNTFGEIVRYGVYHLEEG